jgi:hypothetical protein
MTTRDDLREGLVEIFERVNPGLALVIRQAKGMGLSRRLIEAQVNRCIDREKVGQPPQRGETTRHIALLYIEHLFETEEGR